MKTGYRTNKAEGGIALVLVLWVIVLLTVMAASFSLSLRRGTNLVANARVRAEVSAIADAGIHYAMIMLMQPDPLNRWRLDGIIYEIPFGGARVRVQLYDEAGKVDLNSAKDSMLINLFESVGLPYDEAVGIVDVILDWRDDDVFKRLNGAEEGEYEEAGLDYGPRNKPFQTVEELQLVLGISTELYEKLEPLITVYSRRQGIDPSKSSRQVLMALPDVEEEIIDYYLEELTESALNDLPPPPFPVPIEGARSDSQGGTVSVRAEGEVLDGGRATVLAVIQRRDGGDRPFAFLEWKRSFSDAESLFDQVAVVGNEDLDEREP